MLNYERILVFDFETTGLRSDLNHIIEVGAILVEKNQGITKELSLLVNVPYSLPAEITNITKITDEMLLKEGVSQEEAFNLFFELLNDESTLLVGYNIAFDLSFLLTWIRRHYFQNYFIKNDILDVMAIYRDRYPYPHRLENAVLTYNVENKSTHRALDDVIATYDCLVKMNSEKNNIQKYINKLGFPIKYGPNNFIAKLFPYIRQVPQKGGANEIEKL